MLPSNRIPLYSVMATFALSRDSMWISLLRKRHLFSAASSLGLIHDDGGKSVCQTVKVGFVPITNERKFLRVTRVLR